MPGLRVLTFSAGWFLPPAAATALAWSDTLHGWPEQPGVAISLLWASIVVGSVLLSRSFPHQAPFLAFILPATMLLGAAAAAVQEGMWLWLDPGPAPVPALQGDNATAGHAARAVMGSAIGIGVPLGFVAAHLVALEEFLFWKLWGGSRGRLS